MNVQATVITQPATFPYGTAGGSWRIALVPESGEARVYTGQEPSTVFSEVDPGTYRVRGYRMNADGVGMLGSAQETIITVTPESVTIDVAGGMEAVQIAPVQLPS